jgi:hypothetical protein
MFCIVTTGPSNNDFLPSAAYTLCRFIIPLSVSLITGDLTVANSQLLHHRPFVLLHANIKRNADQRLPTSSPMMRNIQDQ